jgi:Raf kinase inhibitor-like YbhB/YbcL family protein
MQIQSLLLATVILQKGNRFMKRFFAAALAINSCFSTFSDVMAAPEKQLADLTITSKSIENGEPIPEKFAYCAPDGKGKTKPASNISPELSWSGAPDGTKSFAIVVVDPDVPAKFDDANKQGKIIAENFPRKNFYHFVLADIPANITSIPEGMGKKFANGVALINDFAGGRNLPEFAGYDGPCPPWNDARLHHYHFTVYALDVEKLGVKTNDRVSKVVENIEKHAISKGELVGEFFNMETKSK